MKDLIEYINEGAETKHIERIDSTLENGDWSKVSTPTLPVDCWIIEDDFPMGGNSTLKKILTNYDITYKMKRKKAGYFDDKFAVLDIDTEEKWKVYLILNKALCHGKGYSHIDGVSTNPAANKAFDSSIDNVKIL